MQMRNKNKIRDESEWHKEKVEKQREGGEERQRTNKVEMEEKKIPTTHSEN